MIPDATHVTRDGKHTWVTCPYCGNRHKHQNTHAGLNWRAPGCGLYRNAADRLNGYTFKGDNR